MPIINLRPTHELSGVSLDFTGVDFRVQPNALDVDVTLFPLLRGQRGEPGASGSAGGETYEHDQMTPALVWTALHNLGRFPTVVTVDSSDRVIEGAVQYVSANIVTITFSVLVSGRAYLN